MIAGKPFTQFTNVNILDELRINGVLFAGVAEPVTVTGDYTVLSSDSMVLVDASSGPITITLPLVSTVAGETFTVKKIDSSANAVTIDGSASETIDGETTKVLTNQWWALTMNSNSTAWFIK
jgi:hypothetical protein